MARRFGDLVLVPFLFHRSDRHQEAASPGLERSATPSRHPEAPALTLILDTLQIGWSGWLLNLVA